MEWQKQIFGISPNELNDLDSFLLLPVISAGTLLEKSDFSLVAVFNGCLEMKYLLSNNKLATGGKLFNRCIENILAAGTFHF